jgi:hypothetical protein
MPFADRYPTLAAVLGNKSVRMLDEHSADLGKLDDEQAVAHFKQCRLSNICSLYNTGFGKPDDRLEVIEWAFAEIAKSEIGLDGVVRNFSTKVNDDGEFYQLLGELAVALTFHLNGKLLQFEWPTGVKSSERAKEKDADVRGELAEEPVNVEVTMRADPLLKAARFHLEDFVDETGKDIPGVKPTAATRDVLTAEEKEDYSTKGVSIPSLKTSGLAPEPKEVADRIMGKAAKFQPNGLHVVALATAQIGLPSSNHVRYAVFGSSELLQNGIFCDEQCRQLSAVLYLDVFSHLYRLYRQSQGQEPVHERRNKLFLNPQAAVKLPQKVWDRLSTAFEAELVPPHGRPEIIVPKKP